MATSNIKLFDENKANLLTDTEYGTNTQRLNGVQSGVASSKLNNKAMYQVSLVAYAIGQLMAANGKDANDANAVSTFVANMDATLVQKVKDIASSAEAIAGVNNSHFMTPYTTKAAIVNFYNTTIKEEIEDLQAAVPWTKEYVGELTKTTTSIPFITGVPDNFVGLYIEYEIKMRKLTAIDFMSLTIKQEISLGGSVDGILSIILFDSREVNASERIVKDKIYLFKYKPAYYQFDNTPKYIAMDVIPGSSGSRIYVYDNITSTLKFIGANYVSSASIKIYKLLAN